MSCQLNGACELRAELAAAICGARPDDVQIKDVSCLGRCDQAPAVAINDEIFAGVTTGQQRKRWLGERCVASNCEPEHLREARVACASDPYGDGEKYGVVRRLAAIKGLGWRAGGSEGRRSCAEWAARDFPHVDEMGSGAQAAEPVKYIVCNADESEPGTIKDRFIMTHLPHLVIEGMIIAGLVTGAKKGILYIRHEYPLQEEILGEELRRVHEGGIAGKKYFGKRIWILSWRFSSVPVDTFAAKKAL